MSGIKPPKAWLEILQDARKVTVMTGAGMSAESGIATFRDPQSGLWARYRPEELASPEAFVAQPGRVWQWYQWRRKQIRASQPHAGHHALAELVSRNGWSLITQNVDGLHQRTGLEPIEFHGNIWREYCHECGQAHDEAPWPGETPATCQCGGLFRPAVVWFGESIPSAALDKSIMACDCEVFLLIGTSSLVYPAAALSAEAARDGAQVLVMNPEQTPAVAAAHWQTRASEGLVALRQALVDSA